MRLDLYQAETALIAQEQTQILDEARIILSGRNLSRLEQNGVLHSIQVLVENSIGKAKQILKTLGKVPPISAYDSFTSLSESGIIPDADIPAWNAAIGLRNRIVHDYMNIDMAMVLDLVRNEEYRFIYDFLMKPFDLDHSSHEKPQRH
jgi:uncharacterized protein YutE (UPF0331/DUF86 family)